MNERIKEIAVKAKVEHCISHVRLEDFAQLIVRECAKRIDYWESRQGEHCDDLLKHFGVEE
jgi:hypothetical protein